MMEYGWPSWEQWIRVLTWQDYNTRVVLLGTIALGLSAGLIGSFALLRRRALMGDALAHATLPGTCAAFMWSVASGGNGKSLWLLLLGAATSGLLGVLAVAYIKSTTRLKEDAALGIILSVFFGGGVAMLGICLQMPAGHAAGLDTFIYGKTASMIASDAWLIVMAATACFVVSLLLFKELQLLAFDSEFAGSRGYPVFGLDLILMLLVVIVTIVGLQAVGLVLMIALLVIPAAAARFWTESLKPMALTASLVGALSCWGGTSFSALFPKLPSGAMIVLCSSAAFLFSLFLGYRRGVALRWIRRYQFNRKIDSSHLLRGLYELSEKSEQCPAEATATGTPATEFETLLNLRSWSRLRLWRTLRQAIRSGLVYSPQPLTFRLTTAGQTTGRKLVREHRLWELYLITHADIAPSRVDRDADAIEHVLEPSMIEELELLLAEQVGGPNQLPPNPHAFGSTTDSPPSN